MSQVVLITRGSTGIRRDLAPGLIQAGYTVVATARKIQSLDSLRAALKLQLDVTRGESTRQSMNDVIERFGHSDVLVNNAGDAQIGPVDELSDKQIQQMFDVSLFAGTSMTRTVVPLSKNYSSFPPRS